MKEQERNQNQESLSQALVYLVSLFLAGAFFALIYGSGPGFWVNAVAMTIPLWLVELFALHLALEVRKELAALKSHTKQQYQEDAPLAKPGAEE